MKRDAELKILAEIGSSNKIFRVFANMFHSLYICISSIGTILVPFFKDASSLLGRQEWDEGGERWEMFSQVSAREASYKIIQF